MWDMNSRQAPIVITFLIGAFLLTYKLSQIQLFDDTYKQLAEKTILDKQTVYPSRGLIYDRNNQLLTFNKPIYDLESIYRNVDPKMDTSLFCRLLDINNETFNKSLNKNWRDKRFHKSLPHTFISRINPEKYSRFQEHLFRFPGFYPLIRNIRAYPHTSAPHVLGYLKEVDQNIIDKENSTYQLGDYIGATGLESQYESILKGKKGFKFLLRDNVGREVSAFAGGELDSLAKEGSDIYTSIDLDLQAYCEKLMQNKRGSIVVLEPSTGEVLSMVSAPSFDPNLLNLDEDRGKAFRILTADKEQKPLFDRAISSGYPPGSIFKPILSLIAFQEGVMTPYNTVTCFGKYKYRTFEFGCHDHTPTVNVKSALMYSCNSYFFTMIRKLIEKEGFNKPEIGLNVLRTHLTDFGLGNKLGIDLLHESGGSVPSPSDYNYLYRNSGGKWRSTYIMSIGIGQGELELTTLQMANLAAILANRGYFYRPHIVTGFSDSSLSIDPTFYTKNEVKIDKQYFEPVIDGLYRTITSGTGYRAAVRGIQICGKTGTSENAQGDDHSVFFAFAPKDNPTIALAVYVENAGFGGDIAAPIASLVIEKYIKGEIKRTAVEERIVNINLIEKP